jgi:hypothetical protein
METVQSPPATVDHVKPMSFTDAMVNVFASPGEVFENVRQTPVTHKTWVVPTVLLVIIGALLAFVIMSNPAVSEQYRQQSKAQMEKQFDKQVQEGKMTQEQADRARAQAEQFSTPTMMIIWGLVVAVIGPFVILFFLGLVYWLLGKTVMKATTPFFKTVEVVGLTFYINILESIVTVILIFGLGNAFATPSLALFIPNFSPDNRLDMLAGSANIFTFWILGVVSIGLSRVFQKDFPKVLILVVALWVLWTLLKVFGFSMLRG